METFVLVPESVHCIQLHVSQNFRGVVFIVPTCILFMEAKYFSFRRIAEITTDSEAQANRREERKIYS